MCHNNAKGVIVRVFAAYRQLLLTVLCLGGLAHARNVPILIDEQTLIVVKKIAVTGRITMTGGPLPAGSVITAGGATAQIGADGIFTLFFGSAGNYRLTPSSPGGACTFSPFYVDVVAGTDISNLSFTATCPPALPEGAEFVSQSQPTPKTIGEAFVFTVTMRNSGSSTWNPSTHSIHSTDGTNAWGTGSMPVPASVPPGQSVTFNLNLTAPPSAATYILQWRMYNAAKGQFGSATPGLAVVVHARAKINYIHSDHLSTPRLITQASDNKARWVWDDVDPFGNNQANEDPSSLGAFTFNLRFPGQYYDAETATHYNYFRDYDPGTGRYVESDPIGLGGGINTYAYVGGNPLSLADPSGLQVPPIGLGGFGAAGSGGGAAAAGGVGSGSSSGSAAIALGLTHLIHKIVEACTKDCDPPKGTVCFFIDRVPPSKPHFPIPGSHYHLFQMNQAPDGSCHWNYLGASATAPPGAISCPFERTKTR